MKLYGYFRSSASYRVRIALNLKGLSCEHVPVNLLKGEQKKAGYLDINPQGLLPSLEDNGQVLTQSLAIIEYLEEAYPTPPLLPITPVERARVRAIALAIACEIAPLNNLGAMNFLKDDLQMPPEIRTQWYNHWIGKGFAAVEAMLNDGKAGHFCHGDTPSIVDCVLVPQVFNARRYNCDLSAYPTIVRIAEHCETLPAFADAHPGKQPDAT